MASLFRRRKEEAHNEEVRSFFPYIQRAWSSGIFSQCELNDAVDTCVSRISNTISTLPITLYQHTSRGAQEAWYDNLYQILRNPAIEESQTLFYKTLVRCLLTKGNFYARIGRDLNGNIAYLQIVDPLMVRQDRDQSGRKIFYINGEYYTEYDILHIPYPGEGYNGDVGRSPLDVHKDVIQQNTFIKEYIALYFKKGTNSKLLVSLGDDFKANKGDLNKLVEAFYAYYNEFVVGSENVGMPIITPPGTDISKLEMNSNVQSDVQSLLDSSNAAVARLFNIPPEVLFSSENKYGSLEQKNADYLEACIKPLAKHIAECLENLIPWDRRGSMFISFSYDDLLETDIQAKQDRVIKALHSGLITLAEARSLMHLPAIQNEVEANTKWIPANLIPLTEDNINAMLAKSKLALQEYKNKDSAESVEDKFNNHNGNAMDKNM